jgi:hypothetical protein
MKKNQFAKVTGLLERLDEAKIPYTMQHSRDDAIMVVAFAPGEYWEIEFVSDGEIAIERFRSNGKVQGEEILEELFALCSDEEPVTGSAPRHDNASAGK